MPPEVLLVDDEPDLRMLVRFHLESLPFEVVGEASNGAEAVELVKEHCPHLVLMDIQMPVMNGIQATKLIRDECPHTTVFGFTAVAERSADDLLRAGAAAVFEKTQFPELLDRLKGLFQV